MSFLYINDPKKREQIVVAYLTRRKNGILREEKPIIQEQEDGHDEIVYDNEAKEFHLPIDCKIVQHFKNMEVPAAEGKRDMDHVMKLHLGNGIQFLPGDINGLQIKLDYLLAEYHAGNTSATRGQIVAITDELLRRKVISKAKYTSINTYIQNEIGNSC